MSPICRAAVGAERRIATQDRMTDSSDNNATHAHSTMRMVFKEDIADDPYTIPIGSNGRTDMTSIASHVLRINQKSINQSIPNSNNPSRIFESRLIAVRPKISLSKYRTVRAAPHVSPRDLHSRRDPCAVGGVRKCNAHLSHHVLHNDARFDL